MWVKNCQHRALHKSRARHPPMRDATRGAEIGGSTNDIMNLEASEGSPAAAAAEEARRC
jgi:hypothetical protein